MRNWSHNTKLYETGETSGRALAISLPVCFGSVLLPAINFRLPLFANSLLEPAARWWQEATMWTLMYRGGLLAGLCGVVAFVLWRIVAARRERTRLEALVASRTRQYRQSEELFRSIFEHATEGIFQSSLDGRNLRSNPAMARICGFANAEKMQEELTNVATQFYVQTGRREQIIAEIAQKGAAVDCESEIRRPDGSTIWIAESVRTVVDPATGDTVYQGSIVDITARKEMQAAQEQARAAAEAANAAKSAFLAHMTHELRTPLTGILSSARVALRDPALDTKHRERYALIASSGEHLLRLVEEVLDFSRIEAGRLELRPGPFNLAELLGAITDGFRPWAAEKRLEFLCEIEPKLPLIVCGDVLRLRQVLDNLIGNAFKFTDEGKIVLKIGYAGARPDTPGSAEVHFEVTDTGIGIAADQLATIFQPFQQISTAGRAIPPGAGLGLNISARLVALMEGKLHVESPPGRGSCFSFDIPLPDADGGETIQDQRVESPIENGIQPSVSRSTLVYPPETDLDVLVSLSLGGDIVRLRESLAAMTKQNPAYAAFASELERLTSSFRMNAISEFLDRGQRQSHGHFPAKEKGDHSV